MQSIILMIHILAIVALIALILIQQGKGANMGAAFGSGSSESFFGSGGAGSFMVKLTAVFVFIFFATSISLGYMSKRQSKMENTLQVQQSTPISLPKDSALPITTQNPKTDK